MDILKLRKIPLKRVLQGGSSLKREYSGNTHYAQTLFKDLGTKKNEIEQINPEQVHTTVRHDMIKIFTKELPFSDPKEVVTAINNDRESIIIVGLGVDWSFPVRATLEQLSRLSSPGVKVFLVNEDHEEGISSFSSNKSDIAGVPYTYVYWRGNVVNIIRHGEDEFSVPTTRIVAMAAALLDAARDVFSDVVVPSSEIVLKVPF